MSITTTRPGDSLSRTIYITAATPLGGFEEYILPEMAELVRQGHSLLIVPRSPWGPKVTQAEAMALQPYCMYQPLLSGVILRAGVQELARNPKKCLALIRRIIFRSCSFWHVLKNLAVFPKSLWLTQLARAWKADHLHAHWALSTATMAMIAGELTGIPWSFTAHRGDIIENNMLEEKVQRAAFVRFISQNGLNLAQSMVQHDLRAKSHVIYMGVRVPRELTQPGMPRDSGFTIMCPALLLPRKGHIFLLQAISALKGRGLDCQLLLAGHGPLLGKLQRQIKELDIGDRVKFLGHLSHDALLKYYEKQLVDLVVLASGDKEPDSDEGIPVSLMEAMAYGIPVIACPAGGTRELITEGTGILVPPRDPDALGQAIQRVMEDADLRQQLARAGHQRIEAAFSVKNTIEKLAPLFAGALCRENLTTFAR